MSHKPGTRMWGRLGIIPVLRALTCFRISTGGAAKSKQKDPDPMGASDLGPNIPSQAGNLNRAITRLPDQNGPVGMAQSEWANQNGRVMTRMTIRIISRVGTSLAMR